MISRGIGQHLIHQCPHKIPLLKETNSKPNNDKCQLLKSFFLLRSPTTLSSQMQIKNGLDRGHNKMVFLQIDLLHRIGFLSPCHKSQKQTFHLNIGDIYFHNDERKLRSLPYLEKCSKYITKSQ